MQNRDPASHKALDKGSMEFNCENISWEIVILLFIMEMEGYQAWLAV